MAFIDNKKLGRGSCADRRLLTGYLFVVFINLIVVQNAEISYFIPSSEKGKTVAVGYRLLSLVILNHNMTTAYFCKMGSCFSKDCTEPRV